MKATPKQSDGLAPVDRRSASPSAKSHNADGDSCTKILTRDDVAERDASGEGLWFDVRSRLFMCGRPATARVGMGTFCAEHTGVTS